MAQLIDLPQEILILIFNFLDLPNAYAAQSTCKHINELFKISPQLCYRLQSQFSVVLDNPSCSISLADRVLSLQRHEEAWRKLPLSLANISIARPHAAYFDICGGVFMLGHADGIPVPGQHQGVSRAIWSLTLENLFPNGQHTSLSPTMSNSVYPNPLHA
jgi:hypothetical protein